MNEGYSHQTIEGALAARIVEASSMLHIGGNLGSGESIKIAKMLIQEYPTSSLEDFTLMLQRGIIGRYGKVFGFDISVVFGWMGYYMEDWAEEKERQLAKLKSPPVEIERPESNAIPRPDIDETINELLNKLKDSKVKSMPSLTREEIRQEGQSEPPRKKAIARPSTPQEYVQKWQRKQEWIKLFTESDGGDGWKVKEGSPSFDTWMNEQLKTKTI